MDEVWWRGVSYKVGDNGTVELIEKTDATAKLRSGSKESSELLATGIQRQAVEVSGEDDTEGSNADNAETTEFILPSQFSKRSRN